jgi:hypothetical protein
MAKKGSATSERRLAASAALVGYCVWSALLAPCLSAGEEARIKGTPTNDLADSVLHDVLKTPLGKTLPPLRWEFFLIDDYRIAASSDGAGKIFVTVGMARWYLGRARGIWAAVLTHEMGHALILHPGCWPGFQARLQQATQQASADRDPQPAAQPLLAWSPKGGVFNVRNPKQREYAADCIAMLLMAEAGYHPEYALVLDRWFSGSFYDPPKFTTLFTSHPRWKDREERARQSYDAALAIFNSHWPDAARSPGGVAPPAGKLGRVTAQRSPDDQELLINVPFSLVKAEGVQARVAAVCLAGRTFVQSKDPRFRAPDGSLELNDSFPGSASLTREVSFRLPIAALDTHERKLRLVVFLTAGDLVLDVRYLSIEFKEPRTKDQ